MEGRKYTVFYSWQSNCNNSRKIIGAALDKAKEELNKSEDSITVLIDKGTDRVSGMPQIDTTILSKIMNCNVFVADVTPVYEEDGILLPNPNVLLELGFAMGVVGLSRIILLAHKGKWNPKDLPFDINHKRIDLFKDTKDLEQLSSWIRLCIESAIDEGRGDARMRRLEHDKKHFLEFNSRWPEEVFLGSFETISRNSTFNDYELEIWEMVKEWLSKTENMFVTKSIKKAAAELLKAICDFEVFTIKYWSASVRRWCSDSPIDEKDDLRIKLNRYYEWEPECPKHSLFYQQREDEVYRGIGMYIPVVEKSYHQFRIVVKEELYI